MDSLKCASTVAALSVLVVLTATQLAWADTPRQLFTTQASKTTQQAASTSSRVLVYRMYNPASKVHHYTTDANERDVLKTKHGWRYENVGWIAPNTGTPVYRLYDPKSGEHLYTADANEKKVLTSKQRGWRYEGVAWYSDTGKQASMKVSRLYLKGLPAAASHHYTMDANETAVLSSQRGWRNEGAAWYASGKGYAVNDGWVKTNSGLQWWNNNKQTKGSWISTNITPSGTTTKSAQRYWIDNSGIVALSRVVDPSTSRDKGAASYAFYATSSGSMLRSSKAAISSGVILADSTGKLESAKGWMVTAKYDGYLERYYMLTKGGYSVAKTGLFTVSGTKYYGFPDSGYIMRNTIKYVGENWYKADNDGKLTVYKTSRTTHINRYVNWALGIANDNSHGYSQYNRWGPDYDCSSLVIASLKASGFRVGNAIYTGNMRSELTKYGFKWYTDLSKIDRGDILLNEVHHTAIHLGNGRQVAATISEKGTIYGKPGDQTGREICVQNYFNYPWNGFLRYEGK